MVEEEDKSLTMTSHGLVSKEIRELVVTGVEVEDARDVALKDCCSQRDASTSGVGLLRKMSISGIHDSMFLSLFSKVDLCSEALENAGTFLKVG